MVRFDGQLKQQLEVFGSVLERTTDPRLEARLIVSPSSSLNTRWKKVRDLSELLERPLAVQDLPSSRAFYESLGFTMIGGEAEPNWLILRNGEATIGLFQGMFENDLMTFNPGWSGDGEHPETFTDIRDLQKQLKTDGLTLTSEADEATTGPASLTLVDPDGNMILLDQHR